MGACDWLCCCGSSDKTETKPVEQPAPAPTTTNNRKFSGKLIITQPGLTVDFNKLGPRSALTPRTPANEIPPYLIKVKHLIFEPTPKNIRFNIRPSRDTLIPRPDILEKLQKAIEQNKILGKISTTISQEPTLNFPGGIGKTETVRQYIETNSDRYNHIVWIDAESRITVQNSFLSLAESMGKYIYDDVISDKYKKVSSLVKEIFRILMKQPCLIILDNLSEEYSNFKANTNSLDQPSAAREFLPTYLEDRVKPVILITSNKSDWTAWSNVELNELEADKCASYILKQLKLEESAENKKLALEMAELTARSPLFLEMTLAHIKIESQEDTIGLGLNPMQDFLEFFNQSQRRILPLRPADAKTDPYLHVLLMATINKINEYPKCSRIAMNCLNAMAYMTTVKIPKKMLASFFPLESPKLISESLKVLTSYSLVQDVDEFFEMHRVVQEALIETLRTNSREDKVLAWTITEMSLLLQQLSPSDKHYREVLACACSIEFHIQDQYSNLTYLDYAKLVQEKIQSKYFEKAYEIAQRISKYHESARGREHRGFFKAQHDMALALLYQKQYTPAAKLFTDILDPAQKYMGRNSILSLELSFRLGTVYTKLGKLEEAQALYEQSLEGRKKTRGEDLPVTLETEYYLASLLHQRGQHEEAFDIIIELIPKYSEFSGSDHVGTLNARILKASVMISLENYDQVSKELDDVMAITMVKYGRAHPITVRALRQQSRLKVQQQKHTEGLKIFFEILEIQLKHHVLDPEAVMETNNSMGRIFEELKRFEEALRLYAQASDYARAVLDVNDPMMVANEANIGAVLNVQGRVEEALEMYARVYERQKELLGADHESTMETKSTMIRVAGSELKFTEALRVYTEDLDNELV